MSTTAAKPLGAAAPVLFILAVGCWLYLLRSATVWMGKMAVPGRETDRIMQQVHTGVSAVAVWILLGGVLLLANAKDLMPASVGAVAWVAHPVSCLAAVAAIVVMYDPRWRLALAIPGSLPVLIAAYVCFLFLAQGKGSPAALGLWMWGIVLAASLPILPAAVNFLRVHGDSGSIDATPGPKLDAWMAKQRDQRRADGLAVLARVDAETEIREIENLTRGDSPVREEALAAMRRLPHRQEEVLLMLRYDYTTVLPLLPDIDLQPTPELCEAARQYLQHTLVQRRKVNGPDPQQFVGVEYTEGIRGLGWLAQNCDCAAELDQLEAFALAQQDVPEVRNFIAALRKARKNQ